MIELVTLRDYLHWHDDYDRPGSRLHLRLLAVQDLVGRALDELPAGPVRVVSLCAGQGRDIVTVARRHRRGDDLEGVLVELDPRNVALARQAIAAAGLDGLVVLEADAGDTSVYADHVPADLVLFCGVFGNIGDADLSFAISWLPRLCREGAWAIWTGYPRGDDIGTVLESRFAAAGFVPRALVMADEIQVGVGAGQLSGRPPPFEPDVRLFEFAR